MSDAQEKNTRKSPVPMKKSAIRGGVIAAAAAVIVLLLFGKIGKNWLIGTLAAACCFLGVFLCSFGWGYLKAVENYYKANPELMQTESAAEPADAEKPDKSEQKTTETE